MSEPSDSENPRATPENSDFASTLSPSRKKGFTTAIVAGTCAAPEPSGPAYEYRYVPAQRDWGSGCGASTRGAMQPWNDHKPPTTATKKSAARTGAVIANFISGSP